MAQDSTESVIDYLSAALNRLDNGEELNERECMQIITKLEDLHAEDAKENEQDMLDTDMDKLLAEFCACADTCMEYLQAIQTPITSGKIPEDNDLIALNSTLAELQHRYHLIYSSAMAQLPQAEMPQKGLPAAQYVDAVKNSFTLQYKRQSEEYCNILKSFSAVCSLAINYAVALQPFQEKANRLLADISSGQMPELEELKEQTAGPKVFLDTISCEDLDSDVGMALLDTASEYYPRRVQNGLAAGKYYLPNETNTLDSESVKQNTNNSEYLITGENSNDSTVFVTQHKTDDIKDMPAEAVIDNSQLFAQIIETSGLISQDDINADYKKYVSPGESKKIGSSIFQNDVRNGSEKTIKRIIKDVATRSVISTRSVNLLDNITKPLVQFSMNYLYQKGYLRNYVFSSYGEFYCASPRLIKALSYHDAAKMVDVNQRIITEYCEPSDDIAASVICRAVYETIYCDSVQRFKDDGYSSFSEQTKLLTDSFLSKVCAQSVGGNACDIIVGAFWKSTSECNAFFEKVKTALENSMPARSVIFAAYDQEKAQSFATVMLKAFEQLHQAKSIYLYSYSDINHYLRLTGQDVSALQ